MEQALDLVMVTPSELELAMSFFRNSCRAAYASQAAEESRKLRLLDSVLTWHDHELATVAAE